jgi:hypothetical protein
MKEFVPLEDKYPFGILVEDGKKPQLAVFIPHTGKAKA